MFMHIKSINVSQMNTHVAIMFISMKVKLYMPLIFYEFNFQAYMFMHIKSINVSQMNTHVAIMFISMKVKLYMPLIFYEFNFQAKS